MACHPKCFFSFSLHRAVVLLVWRSQPSSKPPDTKTHRHANALLLSQLFPQLHRQGLLVGKGCSVAWVGVNEKTKEGRYICRKKQDKGAAQDEDGVYVYVCGGGCRGGGWESAL